MIAHCNRCSIEADFHSFCVARSSFQTIVGNHIYCIEWASAQVPPTPLYLGGTGERERETERERERERWMDGWMDR